MLKKHAGLQRLGQQAAMLADVHSPSTVELHWQLRCVGRGRPSGSIRSSPWMAPLVWKPLCLKPMPKKAPPSKPSLQQVGQPISTEACEGNWRQRTCSSWKLSAPLMQAGLGSRPLQVRWSCPANAPWALSGHFRAQVHLPSILHRIQLLQPSTS